MKQMPENISLDSKIIIDGGHYSVVAIANRPERFGFTLEDDTFKFLYLLIYTPLDEEWILSREKYTPVTFVKVEGNTFFFTHS